MKNSVVPKFRHELKFSISETEQEIIKHKLDILLQRDSHAEGGIYRIRSLYFDDWKESAYEEKLAGVESRKKYRIRIYNDSDAVIKLERKRKEGSYIQKVSASLTRAEADCILAGEYEFLRKRKEPICHDFYWECMANGMRSSVIVDYEREPYVYPYGDVRITFDTHVRAGVFSDNLFDAAVPVMEVMEPGLLIMEVKYTEFLPEIIRDLLPTADSAQMAYSKYTLCKEMKKGYTM